MTQDEGVGGGGSSQDGLLEMWAYEARRLFRDRLVGERAMEQFDAILSSVLRSEWSSDASSSLDRDGGAFFVTWGGSYSLGGAEGSSFLFDKPLGRLSAVDMQEVVTKAIVTYSEFLCVSTVI